MRYKLFGRTGLRVSELALGTLNFGRRWQHGAHIEDARRMLDEYARKGGNFIDTSDSYQYGESEEYLGELLEGRREEFVLATKFSQWATPDASILVTGNSRKAMVTSLEASLKRLKTDRIDLYWVHYPDEVTPTDEIMRGFEDLIRAGKILYAGLSDFPAWRVAHAATLDDWRGYTPLAGIQVEHSVLRRSMEYEFLPMAQALGLGLTTWSPLGGGVLTGKYRNGEAGRHEAFGGLGFVAEEDTKQTAVINAVLEVANECHLTPSQVAIAWSMTKGVIPIIGPRTMAQLEDNLAAADITLTSAHIDKLD
ncbi:aldo/keto reductase [Pseudovibrio sp. WM33]|uniref:aldo/keto reductase n=1 Tax=Pseudovibrio sp. WM33 TaxID=1735585 RepID=UPI0007B205F4|nr:aldo/keto reductase [Pseudovibrio sp. WM33]KZL24676.1 L-glyceraldehyde 3-phosphate reductase [Pseudovibrio sp. WM33]